MLLMLMWLACAGSETDDESEPEPEPNPVSSCTAFPDHDCCESDAQCADFYGDAFPHCITYDPWSEGEGICAECRPGTSDCTASTECERDDEAGALCL